MIDADPQFLAFLQAEESRAYDGTLLSEVEAAINSYNGANYGDEEDGRSQVVARDVSESCDYMLTSILDVMGSSANVIEFEPQNEGDEDLCDDATQALHVLYRQRRGFRTLHDWAKAGLLEKIAIIKTCAEQKKRRVEALYHPAEFPEHAIQAQETDQPHPVDGSPMIHAVTLEDSPVQFRDYHVPLEEFGFSPDTTADLDASPYLNHHPLKTLSELIEMGYPREVVEALSDDGSASFADSTSLSQARDDGRSLSFLGNDRPGILRKVRYLEEYTFYDLDGDGIAERILVCRVGNTILNIEPLDEQPFEVWCSFPMQGRLIGQSFADKTMDIQRVNTVLERSMLDSMYLQLSPGTFVHEESVGDHTIDDLLTVRPGRLVRYRGAAAPIPEVRVDVSSQAMQAIEFKIRQRESRTGITRLNKGVDEDTLNDTAKGQAQLMSRGQQMERYVIRQFGEGFGRLAAKKVRLMRKYGQPFQIRVDGEYRTVDPSQWPEDFEVQVKVGLGSGSKEDRIMGRQMLGQVQSMLKMSGSPIVTDENLYNNAIGLSRDLGLPPNDLFTDVPRDPQGNPIPQQPPPDPKVMALMAQVQVKQQAIEAQRQADAAKLQQMQEQHVNEAQLEIMRQHMEAALAVREQNLQAFIDQQQMLLEAHKHAQQMDNQQKIAKMRPGGKLDK
jgi:hypothetical protein